MTVAEIKKRLRAIEAELADLKKQGERIRSSLKRGWRRIMGSFSGDKLHAKAMELGRKYRSAQRPKRKKR